ncbi:MAG: hypothetical protein V3R87_04985 [Dehalococcoidia bacterium]
MRKKGWMGVIGALVVMVAIVGLIVVPAMAQETDETSSPTRSERADQFFGKVAENLGVGTDQLTDAMTDAKLAMIDDAVADGLITEERAEEIKQNILENGGMFGLRGHGPRGHGFGHMGYPGMDAAVDSGIITQEQVDEMMELRGEARAHMQEGFGAHNFGQRGLGGGCWDQ